MSSGNITTRGKNIAMDRLYNGGTYSYILYAQVGMCNKTPAITDTEVISPIPVTTSSRVVIDACDATTGWSVSGDATSVVLDTTAGNRLEGTGALDLRATYSTGTATYYKTVSSFDGSTDYMFWAFYINDLSLIASGSDAISINLGTAGFTDYNVYNFNKDILQTGWNAVVCDVDNPDSIVGAGATEATIDRIRANVNITADLTTDDIIMDWIHTYPIADTWLSWESGYPTFNETNKTGAVRFSINSTEANGGYIIREGGLFDSTKTYLHRRDTFTSISKNQYISVTWDETDKIN